MPAGRVFMFQNGAGLTNEDNSAMTLDTPEAREALQFVADQYRGRFVQSVHRTSTPVGPVRHSDRARRR